MGGELHQNFRSVFQSAKLILSIEPCSYNTHSYWTGYAQRRKNVIRLGHAVVEE